MFIWRTPDPTEKYRKNIKDVNCTDWEIDYDTGSIAYVIIPNSIGDIHRKIESNIEWIKDNATDEWFFDYEAEGVVFYFKKYDDALTFKLTCI